MVQLNPFRPWIEGRFSFNNLDNGRTIIINAKTYISILWTIYAWVLLETKCWDQYWRYLCFQGAFLHFTKFQQKLQWDSNFWYLLWGSCEIPVFILPIKTILSELFRLDWALDCEWRDLKLETNFVLRNFYYLWKSSYISIFTISSFFFQIHIFFLLKNLLGCGSRPKSFLIFFTRVTSVRQQTRVAVWYHFFLFQPPSSF